MNINKHAAFWAFLNSDGFLHIVNGSLSFHCFWKLALQTKSGPTSLVTHAGYPFWGATSWTEQLPPTPLKAISSGVKHAHICLWFKALTFAQDSFWATKQCKKKNKGHIDFTVSLPYFEEKDVHEISERLKCIVFITKNKKPQIQKQRKNQIKQIS